MKKTISILVVVLLTLKLNAQSSVLQDGAGETSFQLFTSSTLSLNFKESSIGFSINPESSKIDNNENYNYWIITGVGNSKDGTSNIFKGGKLQFSGKLGVNYLMDKTNYGDRNSKDAINFRYSFISAELIYSRYNVFNSMATFSEQINDQANLGARINYGWNFLNFGFENSFLKHLGSFSSGISGSIGIKDNTDLLDISEIITSTQTINEGNSQRTVSETTSAYLSSDIKRYNKFARVNFDLGKYLYKSRIFANLHLNYNMDEKFEPTFNPSIGIFATKKGAPLEAIVGIQLQTNDWFNSRNSKKDRWERTALVLTAGFPFN